MAATTTIEWTDTTWNPVTGCTKIGAGCDNCYAARFSERFRGVPGHPFETGFDLTFRPERLLQPLGWRTPRMIFVNSMSDLFHKEIPSSYIAKVFDTMEQADWHIYQVLTKRSSRLEKFVNERFRTRPAPAHIWLGVSVEDQQATSRIVHLRRANASTRALCLLDPYGLDLEWNVMRAAGRSKAVDMFLNFPVMDMNRNVIWKDPNKVPSGGIERMTRFWGDESWKQIAYAKSPQGNLFAPEMIKQGNETIVAAFRERLKTVAGFKFVSNPLPMRNTKKATVYYLILASPKEVAHKIINDIFARYQKPDAT